jgi:hypothetical protein
LELDQVAAIYSPAISRVKTQTISSFRAAEEGLGVEEEVEDVEAEVEAKAEAEAEAEVERARIAEGKEEEEVGADSASVLASGQCAHPWRRWAAVWWERE